MKSVKTLKSDCKGTTPFYINSLEDLENAFNVIAKSYEGFAEYIKEPKDEEYDYERTFTVIMETVLNSCKKDFKESEE